jgi:hypothetical protein
VAERRQLHHDQGADQRHADVPPPDEARHDGALHDRFRYPGWIRVTLKDMPVKQAFAEALEKEIRAVRG